MIQAIRIRNHKQTPCSWWPSVKAFARRRVFRFTPGINILWGPNGSGKSTLLRALARLTHCEQGGVSTVTQQSVSELHSRATGKRETEFLGGATLEFDGGAVQYFDAGTKIGLMGGGAAFDYDFIAQGVANIAFKGSAGEGIVCRMADIFTKPAPAAITWKMQADRVNDLWKSYLQNVEVSLQPTIERGPHTVLLDEPERSLDWENQARLWDILPRLVTERGVQLIVASHSLFAMDIAGANYIEMEKGYRDTCLGIVRRWAARATSHKAES